MIRLTSTTIKVPQGESGAVTFYFKDKRTDYPLILAKLPEELASDINYARAIRFTVKDSLDINASVILQKTYLLDDFKDNYFKSFNDDAYHVLPEDSDDYEKDVLYVSQQDGTGANLFQF